MLNNNSALVAAFALMCALASPAMAEGGHDHGAAPAGLELDHGEKWKADAPLRKGMSEIRKRTRKMPVDAAAAVTLAKDIQGDIDYIVKNCHLNPKADATLHVILHDMLAGKTRLEQGKTAAEREQGLHQVHRALATYPRYFDHPGWGSAGN